MSQLELQPPTTPVGLTEPAPLADGQLRRPLTAFLAGYEGHTRMASGTLGLAGVL